MDASFQHNENTPAISLFFSNLLHHLAQSEPISLLAIIFCIISAKGASPGMY